MKDDDAAYLMATELKKVITSKSRGRSFSKVTVIYADKARNFVVDKEDAVADDLGLYTWYKKLLPMAKLTKKVLHDFLKSSGRGR